MKKHAATLVLLLLAACDQHGMSHEEIVAAGQRCVNGGMNAEVRSNGIGWTVTCRPKGMGSR